MTLFTSENYKVADIKLAKFGRKEIELAKFEMPELMVLRKKYVTCSQKSGHSKLEFSGIINNFKNVIIAYETLKIYGITDFICSSAS